MTEKARNIYALWKSGEGDMDELAIGIYDLAAHYDALLKDYKVLHKQINDPGGAWADLERKLEIAEQRVEGLEELLSMFQGFSVPQLLRRLRRIMTDPM